MPTLESHPFDEPPKRDNFDEPELLLDWQFIRNPQSRAWSLNARPGHLRLMGSAATLDDVQSQSAVVQRQRHFAVQCRAKLDFKPGRDHEEAGLFVRAREGFHYDLALRHVDGERQVQLLSTVAGARVAAGTASAGRGPIVLEVEADAQNYTFSIVTRGRRRVLGALPTRPLSSEYISKRGPMHFTGAMIGLYATGHGQRCRTPADFDWFEYSAGKD